MVDKLVMAFRILIVEDSKEVSKGIAYILQRDCAVTIAETIADAKDQLQKAPFDLVLLDLTLPDGDGLKVCSFIRQSPNMGDLPIFFLTGRSEIEDKEMAFSMGADDYLVKPIDARELKARVLSRLQRAARKSDEIFHAGNLQLNIPLQQVTVGEAGSPQALDFTSLEFKILYYFCKSAEVVFTRDQLITAAWGENVHILERTVDSHISRLRKKLAAAGASHTIHPVHGTGYRFSSRNIRKKAA